MYFQLIYYGSELYESQTQYSNKLCVVGSKMHVACCRLICEDVTNFWEAPICHAHFSKTSLT